ncbi:MAG: SGNH/GDSL hydrolase family protein [Leptolyngbyaceae cyanobacterium]
MNKQVLAVGIAISSCLIPLRARAASYTGLNVFGDSLVDSGNLFNLTDSLLSPFGLPGLPPTPPYAQRSSNGPIWVDNLAQSLELSSTLATDLLLDPTDPLPTQGVNFAFAGSLSSDTHILDDDIPFLADLFPGYQEQIETFATLSSTVPADPNALYVVWVGSNDYNAAFAGPDPLEASSLAQLPDIVTDNIVGGLTELSALGAREFLVANLPAIGEAPFADFLDAQTQQDISSVLNQLSSAHNELLSSKLAGLSQNNPEINVTTLDIGSLFADILATPEVFGLTNVTESCLTNFRPGFQFDDICNNPDEFLFWDDVHPTTAAYQIVSDFALTTLNERYDDRNDGEPASVPEPGVLLSLVLTGALGYRVSQRK